MVRSRCRMVSVNEEKCLKGSELEAENIDPRWDISRRCASLSVDPQLYIFRKSNVTRFMELN